MAGDVPHEVGVGDAAADEVVPPDQEDVVVAEDVAGVFQVEVEVGAYLPAFRGWSSRQVGA